MDLMRFAQIDGLDAIMANDGTGGLTDSWCDLMAARMEAFPRHDVFPVLEAECKALIRALSASLASALPLDQNICGLWIGLFETIAEGSGGETIMAYRGVSGRISAADIEWMVGCAIDEHSYIQLNDLAKLVAATRSLSDDLYAFYDTCLPMVPVAAAIANLHRQTELLSDFQEVGFGWDDGDYRTFEVTPDRLISIPNST